MPFPIEIVFAAAPAVGLLLAIALVVRRRRELRACEEALRARREARTEGSHAARLQYPDIDLTLCIGCGSCVKACPEDGVLDILHGQAAVVHGARCVGHGRCAEACPTGAIALTLADLDNRRDIPALDTHLEAVGTDGLYVAGELSGFALIKTAITQGTAVADAVVVQRAHRAERAAAAGAAAVEVRVAGAAASAGSASSPAAGATVATAEVADTAAPLDLLIVGAGPAGLACALRAKAHGLRTLVIDQADDIGGTVASYPRRKLVMTQPVDLPLHGRLPRLSYEKEELVELWESVVRKHALSVRTGVRLGDVQRGPDGVFDAATSAGPIRAHAVCLALGRRGSPRRLDVAGEHLPKVAYSLIDAQSYQGRKVVVVGGGDSAVEAAVALARQPGNRVTLSYRKDAFSRLKGRNRQALDEARRDGSLDVVVRSEVVEITAESVRLRVDGGDGSAPSEREVPNDDVFVFAGGVPPFALLERIGVSFDPADRPPAPVALDRGSGLLVALIVAFSSAVAVLAWAYLHRSYYGLDVALRATAELHAVLRPAGAVGVTCGLAAVALMGFNLMYLVRRSRVGSRLPGTLRTWMAMHLCTGLFALMAVLVHAGFAMRSTVGGYALLALMIVVSAGAVGRYLYAFVPRAANGSELDLDAVREQLSSISSEWDRDARGFGTHVRDAVERLAGAHWRAGLPRRIAAVVSGEWRLRRALRGLMQEGRRADVPEDDLLRIAALARRAHRLAVQASHYEEVRAILAGWRYLHRWLSLLMVLLAIVHIVVAVRYAQFGWPFPGGES